MMLFAAGWAQEERYVAPTEPEVLAKLEQWRDLKFGMIIHWGLYAVPGIVESWSICSEDEEWIPRDSAVDYADYKRWYWGLSREFNPVDFDPDQWAATAEAAGMRYVVFTTKHHDGFAMYDTKYSDFSIARGPFASHPKADVARHVFDAFRQHGMMVGAYYSKPDWHSQDYWWSRYATPNRHVNYQIAKHPQRWADFRHFVYNQIGELTSDYGALDILWLDGGWVCPPREDIGMDTLARIARNHQPGLLIVDRTVGGVYENYQTPEKTIPDRQLPHPWETCTPLSKDWGYVPGAIFKPANSVISMLMEVVAKGGSLLLGIGPTPQGVIEPEVVKILDTIGNWLEVNGEAIYSTRTLAYYQADGCWFTTSKDGRHIYVLCPSAPSATLQWRGNIPAKGAKIVLLDGDKSLRYKVIEENVTVTLPAALVQSGQPFALRFEVDAPRYNDLNRNGRCDAYENPTLSVEARVEDLLAHMTLDEKIGQLAMTMGWEYYERDGRGVRLTPKFEHDMGDRLVGGTWAVMRADPWTQKTLDNGLTPATARQASNAMQQWVRRHTRLGIPLLLAEECPHGHMAIGTDVLPTGLGRAATFDPLLEYELGRAVAAQLSLQGGNVAFGPVLDICRDPRWSRTEEGYGEDPWLSGTMGNAYSRGLAAGGVLPVAKHFSGYGATEGGHNGTSTHAGRRELMAELSLPFRLCPEAAVMSAYNDIDGLPCSANRWLLTDVLRRQWGFRRPVISDLYAIDGLVGHGVATDKREAAAMALHAGVTIDLGAACYGEPLREAIADGRVSSTELDEAVRTVLTCKYELGFFDKDFENIDNQEFNNFNFEELNRQAATESVVLLKNDGLLPLSKSVKRVAVIGPNADNVYNMLGDYTAPQSGESVVTLWEGVQAKLPQAQVEFVKGCAIRDTSWQEIDRAVAAARAADVVIMALGGSSARDFRTNYHETGAADATAPTVSDMESGEGFDRATLSLMGHQQALLQAVVATGTPTVLVMIQGRPLDLTWADAHVPAILTAWYPGSQGGAAVADILFGDANPSGRLPLSYPRSAGQLPVNYQNAAARPDYTDASAQPLYPFGYGLSYTQFDYSALTAEVRDTTVTVTLTVRNSGDCDGSEVVQLYLQNAAAPVALSERRLAAFSRVALRAGESKTVVLRLNRKDLSVMDEDGEWQFISGQTTLLVGASSQDIRLKATVEPHRESGSANRYR